MKTKSGLLFATAVEAAAKVAPHAMQWKLFFGELCSREELMQYAGHLDKERIFETDGAGNANGATAENAGGKPATDVYPPKGCGFVASPEGHFGMTVDKGKHVQWLATVEVPVAPEELMTITETPWQVIKSELKSKLKNVAKMFTFKGMALKLIITGSTMLIVWVGTMLWQYFCAKNGVEAPFIARLFAYLTFADGGVSTNVFYMIGGLLGKMFVMGALFAVLLGGFKRSWRGLVGFVCAPFRIRTKRHLAWFFLGMGLACLLYNFFTGEAVLRLSMVGVAGFLSMLWGIGGGPHFTRRMTVALTAHVNKQSKVHYEDLPKATAAMAGMANGFLMSIALSAIPWGFVPYCAGGLFLILSLVFALLKPSTGNGGGTKQKKTPKAPDKPRPAEQPGIPQLPTPNSQLPTPPNPNPASRTAATTVTAVLLALLLCPANAQAEDWRLELVRAENYADPNADVDYYGGFLIRTGRHSLLTSEEYKRAAEDDGCKAPDGLFFTCSEPPATIAKGDIVTLQLSRNASEHVFFAYNADADGNATPRFNQLCKIRDFLDEQGRSEEFGGEGRRSVSCSFDDEYFADQLNSPAEAAASTEFVICFSTGEGVGETRWIYQYHPTNVAVAVVVVDEEGNVIDSGIIPPAGSGDEGSSGGSGDYGGTSGGGMAGAVGGSVVVAVIVVATRKKPEDEDTVEGRNPEYFKDIKEKHDKWVEEDRRCVQEEIERRKNEHENYVKRKEAEEKAFWHKYNQAHKLKGKYLAIDDEGEGDEIFKSLRRSMIQKQGEWGAESWAEQSKADYIDGYLMINKAVKDSADTGMDMAAEYGGGGYKIFRDVYKAAAEITQTMTDAAVRGKSLKRAALVGTLRAGITWVQYHTDGKAHAFAAVNGEGVRDLITALDEGKSFKEAWEAANKGAWRGTKDAIVDHYTGKFTDGRNVDELTHGEKMGNAFVAAADDTGKIAGDSV